MSEGDNDFLIDSIDSERADASGMAPYCVMTSGNHMPSENLGFDPHREAPSL